jgi:hypothetical protein
MSLSLSLSLRPLAESNPVNDPVRNNIIGFNKSHAEVSLGETSIGWVTNSNPNSSDAVLKTNVVARAHPTTKMSRALISELLSLRLIFGTLLRLVLIHRFVECGRYNW